MVRFHRRLNDNNLYCEAYRGWTNIPAAKMQRICQSEYLTIHVTNDIDAE